MTLQEAIKMSRKTGKPFKRRDIISPLCINGLSIVKTRNNHIFQFTPEDILADDWEIEKTKRKVKLYAYKDVKNQLAFIELDISPPDIGELYILTVPHKRAPELDRVIEIEE